jgi:hypothetical protein
MAFAGFMTLTMPQATVTGKSHGVVVSWYLDSEAFMTNQPDEITKFNIQIDRVHYTVTKKEMTGAELRLVPPEPIGPDRDLFEVVPGHPDRKILDETIVEISNGKRFFTAPAHINPGAQ